MIIIEPSFDIIREKSVTKKIERIARVCYKSEELISEGTDIKMIKMLIKRNHLAMLEHGHMCLQVSDLIYGTFVKYIESLRNASIRLNHLNHFESFLRYSVSQVVHNETTVHMCIVSGNIRAWIETLQAVSQETTSPIIDLLIYRLNEVLGIEVMPVKDIEFTTKYLDRTKIITDYTILTPEERMIHEPISVLFRVDRGVGNELVRMRKSSFAQESTRYCNYSLGKFDNSIVFVKPVFWDVDSDEYKTWANCMQLVEDTYLNLIKQGATPQQARDVLPLSLKSDIVVTTYLDEWRHIFELRACDSTGPAHPQMKEVTIPLLKVLNTTYGFAFGDLTPAE